MNENQYRRDFMPFWVIGCITSYGEIIYHTYKDVYTESSVHLPNEMQGKMFRWNCMEQCFDVTRQHFDREWNQDDYIKVVEFLYDNGWIDVYCDYLEKSVYDIVESIALEQYYKEE